MPEQTPPDMRLRRAQNLIWEPDGIELRECQACHGTRTVNVIDVCWECNFKAKLGSITIVAEPWGLREVRKEHGINGETSPSDNEKKIRKLEADKEFRLTHGLPYEGDTRL